MSVLVAFSLSLFASSRKSRRCAVAMLASS
jgi:hypothetical protein